MHQKRSFWEESVFADNLKSEFSCENKGKKICKSFNFCWLKCPSKLSVFIETAIFLNTILVLNGPRTAVYYTMSIIASERVNDE